MGEKLRATSHRHGKWRTATPMSPRIDCDGGRGTRRWRWYAHISLQITTLVIQLRALVVGAPWESSGAQKNGHISIACAGDERDMGMINHSYDTYAAISSLIRSLTRIHDIFFAAGTLPPPNAAARLVLLPLSWYHYIMLPRHAPAIRIRAAPMRWAFWLFSHALKFN